MVELNVKEQLKKQESATRKLVQFPSTEGGVLMLLIPLVRSRVEEVYRKQLVSATTQSLLMVEETAQEVTLGHEAVIQNHAARGISRGSEELLNANIQ
jgi:hypothetical protein